MITPGQREWIGEGASQGMTKRQGQPPTGGEAKRARGMANSVEANERRLQREPTVIDWDERIANLLDILDDNYDQRRG